MMPCIEGISQRKRGDGREDAKKSLGDGVGLYMEIGKR